MIKIRAVFEKKGRAKYISHLDLNRCMQRIFKRSGLPIWYTEGFNPHIYIMFALPLTLGYESGCEIMDFNLTEETDFEIVKIKLNSVMPEGLRVVSVFYPEYKHTEIGYADFKIIFSGKNPEDLKTEFNKFLNRDEINVIKKTKRTGEKLINIKPDTQIVSITTTETGIEIIIRLPAGTEKNINPALLTDLFINFTKNDTELDGVERLKIICKNGEEFL